MEIIGFSNKYFTLWNVFVETVTTKWDKYQVTHNEYIKNISTDIDKVRELYPNLEIDESLHGHSHSFTIEGSHKDINTDRFNFGKYEGFLISDCTDINYLVWFYDNTYGERKENIKKRLENFGYHFEGELLYSPKDWKIEQEWMNEVKAFRNKLENNEPLEVEFLKNLVVGQDEDDKFFGTYQDNIGIFHFSDIKVNYYNGYEYGLPLLNGKAKRIKNKTIRITKYTYSETGTDWCPFSIKIEQFEIEK